jgi:hypothetical protein
MAETGRVGEIVRLQIQREPLKTSGTYLPGPLLAAPRALISADGMIVEGDLGWLLDAHHRSHPRTRGGGRRALSIGFTGHYEAMRERFGDVPEGIAGENILIDGPPLRLEALGAGIEVRSADGQRLELKNPSVATPCVEFTSYLLGADGTLPRDEMLEDMEFLNHGTRGYIVDAGNLEGYESVAVGDTVLTLA